MNSAGKKQPFDPYLMWLGIRDPRRPPNYYRLLGLELFEYDPAVIQNCADRQMSYVRRFLTGEHAADAQRLLQELIAARACLLDPTAKEAYDAALRQELGAQRPEPAIEHQMPAASASEVPGKRGDFWWRLWSLSPLRWASSVGQMVSRLRRRELAPPPESLAPADLSANVARGPVQNELVYKYVRTAVYLTGLCILLGLGIVLLERVPPAAAPSPERVSGTSEDSQAGLEAIASRGGTEVPPAPEGSFGGMGSDPNARPSTPTAGGESPPALQLADSEQAVQTAEKSPAEDTVQSSQAEQPTGTSRPGISTSASKLPLPDQAQILAARAKFEQNVRGILEENPERSTREQLLGQLLELASQLEDPAEKFALFRLVAEAAVEAELTIILRRAIDELSATFELRREDLVSELVGQAETGARGAEFRRDMARLLIAEAGLAADSGQHSHARSFLEKALTFAQQTKDQTVSQLANEELKRLGLVEDAYRRAVEAQAALASNPDDPGSHLALGLYLCFFRSRPEWEEGLKHLARGNDEKLRSLAEAEVSVSPNLSAKDKVALGDKWREAAADAPPALRPRFFSRAAYWYRSALPETTGFTRLRLEKFLREMAPQGE